MTPCELQLVQWKHWLKGELCYC